MTGVNLLEAFHLYKWCSGLIARWMPPCGDNRWWWFFVNSSSLFRNYKCRYIYNLLFYWIVHLAEQSVPVRVSKKTKDGRSGADVKELKYKRELRGDLSWWEVFWKFSHMVHGDLWWFKPVIHQPLCCGLLVVSLVINIILNSGFSLLAFFKVN